MARQPIDERILEYFLTAPLGEAETTLRHAKAALKARTKLTTGKDLSGFLRVGSSARKTKTLTSLTGSGTQGVIGAVE